MLRTTEKLTRPLKQTPDPLKPKRVFIIGTKGQMAFVGVPCGFPVSGKGDELRI